MNRRSTSLAAPVLVVLAVVLTVLLSGCSDPAAFRQESMTPSYRVTLTVQRPVVGTNAALDVVARDGRPAGDAEIALSPVMTEMGHSDETVVARPSGPPGHYVTSASLFFMSGAWDIDVEVLVPGERIETARFRIVVASD